MTCHYPDLGSAFDFDRAAREICFYSTTHIQVMTRQSMEFLQSLRRRHLAGKPSRNVGCFLTPLISAMKFGLLDFCLISPVLGFSGIVRWGNEIQRILDDGRLLLQQTRAQDITSPITVLLEGWYQLFY